MVYGLGALLIVSLFINMIQLQDFQTSMDSYNKVKKKLAEMEEQTSLLSECIAPFDVLNRSSETTTEPKQQ